MIKTISAKLHAHANGRSIFLLFLLMLVFAVIIVPTVQGKIKALSGGTDLIDLQLFYTAEKIYAMLASYGEAGRSLYLFFAASGDLIYPVVYSVFLGLILSWLLQRAFAKDSRWQMLNVAPLFGMLFDWLENANIITMLSLFPDVHPNIARLGSACTSLKWGFSAASGLLLIAALVLAAKNGFKKR
mgnify:CR=1 FL=1